MRVLLDENLPHDLTGWLVGHQVDTVAGRGWKGNANGKLLLLASDDYNAFLTMDRRLPEQQRIAHLPFGIVLLAAPTNRPEPLQLLVSEILRVLPAVQAGSLVIVGTYVALAAVGARTDAASRHARRSRNAEALGGLELALYCGYTPV